MMGFLARWVRRLSWRETAASFRPVGNRCIGPWSGVCPIANCAGSNRSAWTRFTGGIGSGRQLPHRGLPDRCWLPRLLWIGKRRSEKTLRRGAEGTGFGVRQRTAFCLQRHVEALFERHCRRSRSKRSMCWTGSTSPCTLNQAVDEVRRPETPLASEEQRRRPGG